MNESDGRLWADARGFLYFEVSALNGDGIAEMFQVTHDEKVAAAYALTKNLS